MIPQVYSAATDTLEDVTQKWCDDVQYSMNTLAKIRAIINCISKLHVINDVAIINEIANLLDKHNKYH